jgi:hypothetical protein
MVHFQDEEEDETEVRKQMKLEDSIHNITMINERISLMDKLEALNRDFQAKVSMYNKWFILQYWYYA